jgi:hypothetical protein
MKEAAAATEKKKEEEKADSQGCQIWERSHTKLLLV